MGELLGCYAFVALIFGFVTLFWVFPSPYGAAMIDKIAVFILGGILWPVSATIICVGIVFKVLTRIPAYLEAIFMPLIISFFVEDD